MQSFPHFAAPAFDIASGSAQQSETRSLSNLAVSGTLPQPGLNPVKVNLIGTEGEDRLFGSNFDDIIDGGAGNDVLIGYDGGDVLIGGGGADSLNGGEGSDRLDGGNGDDYLEGGLGDDLLVGGPGDDRLLDTFGNNDLFGGDGNDWLMVNSLGPTTGVQDAGAGDDTLSGPSSMRYLAGAGNDTLQINVAASHAPSSKDLRSNPFGPSGYLKAVQEGADVHLYVRDPGVSGSLGRTPLVILEGVHRASLSSSQFAGAFDPSGLGNGKYLPGTNGPDVLAGTELDDTIDGGSGADRLTGGAGDDMLIGGAGIDSAYFSGAASSYRWTRTAGGWTITDLRVGKPDGNDALIEVERMIFFGHALASDIDGPAGQAYRLYKAAFDRAPDLRGLGFWIKVIDGGTSLHTVAGGFVQSDEFKNLYGASPSNTDIVTRLYANILGRAPEKSGFDFWVDILDTRKTDLAAVLVAFSESTENQLALADVIGQGIRYEPWS